MRIVRFLLSLPLFVRDAWFATKYPYNITIIHRTLSYRNHKNMQKQLIRAVSQYDEGEFKEHGK